MDKYPFLEKSAFLVIGILGLKLCFALVVHFFPSFEWIESEQFDLFVSALTLLIFIIPLLSAKFFQKKN